MSASPIPPGVAATSTPAAAAHGTSTGLMLGALGVVFGDIGTSPIYAYRESLRAAGEGAEGAPLGIASLIFWAVVLVVAIKYVVLVMRADNHGEGGTMALLSLALPPAGQWRGPLLILGLAGASLFFGDAMITPAISVLSAVEGLTVATPFFTPYVIPIALIILVGLFAIQSSGSGAVGRVFGPVMLAWFAVLAAAGLAHALRRPEVFAALSPHHAVAFLLHAPAWAGFTVLGSVFLALTGGEALYADMGHFGRRPIRLDWFALVMPALVLNYLGQAALVLEDPASASNPFFLLFPGWLLYPAVALSTAATVIASQAVLSGAFALVQQAIQLGALPRLTVQQTSEESAGQVYVPQINWLLMLVVLGLVVGFRSSDALANAYGIAVAGDMLVTTVLVSVVAHRVWGVPWPVTALCALPFLVLDLTFVAANAHKIPDGGWFPLLTGAISLTLVLVWRRGRALLLERREEDWPTLASFLARLDGPDAPPRTRGTAIYLTTHRDRVPAALALNLRHNGVLHDRVVLLTVRTERVPRVAENDRAEVEPSPHGFVGISLRFGFAERPDVPAALQAHRDLLDVDPGVASWFIGREVPVPALHPDLPAWQERVFGFLGRNAVGATDYFRIPTSRVVELGSRVEL